MSGVHLVDAERSCGAPVDFLLLSHPVGHEESLVLLVISKPKMKLKAKSKYLHSHFLRRRLALRTSEVANSWVHQGVGKGAVGHGVLVI